MTLLRRHKYILIALGIYWPLLFVLTHIPVPVVAGQSGMSDKTMHVMAYFGLTFLCWYAISPYEKVNWKGRKVWGMIAVLMCYAAADEFLQAIGSAGRSAEMLDVVSNFAGMSAALLILSVVSFWASLLAVFAVFIFVISNMSEAIYLYPQYHLNTCFHFTAYTVFTLIWIQWLERMKFLTVKTSLWLLYSIVLPTVLLLIVEAPAVFSGKMLDWIDIATAVFGITSAALISFLLMKYTRRTNV